MTPHLTPKQEARFWRRIHKTDACWTWTAATRRGYGSMRAGCQMQAAHRLSWVIHNGPIPEGMYVCHRCDNQPCVNPAHLFLGTHADNMADKKTKGRAYGRPRPGELAQGAKLTAPQVLTIRALLLDGARVGVLAKQFGVSTQNIIAIRKRAIWPHLPVGAA